MAFVKYDLDTIFRLLKNSGFRVLGNDGNYLYLEDPSCILRSFETFIEYAWIGITFIAGMLLFGFAISLIRGAKNDLFISLRNLTLIFGILSAAKPIINTIWGDDIFARGCKTIKVDLAQVQKILDARNLKLKARNEGDIYEDLDIYDSYAGTNIIENASISDIPAYSVAPSAAMDIPQKISIESNGRVSVSGYNGKIWGGQCTPSRDSALFPYKPFTTGQFTNTDPVFDKALNTVFRTEGGYVNDALDSGGETKYGISKNNNPGANIKNLTRGDAEKIAHDKYYKKYNIDKLPDAIRGEVFQIGWACGPVVAIKQLQGALNVSKTGRIDDATINAAQEYNGNLRDEYMDIHKKYLIAITEKKPSQKRFIRGWLNRTNLIRDNGCHS